MNSIKLIVGLGNPGREYQPTRHNAGFWWVEHLARAYPGTFQAENKFHGQVARSQIQGHEVLLLKPQTFMNASGRSVAAITQFYKIAAAEMLIVHDELDLPPGSAKLKFGGGHGGHNGLKDILLHGGTADYWRLRIGIGHPGERSEVVNYVLQAPRHEESQLIEQAMQRALDVAHLMVAGRQEAAMLKLHSA